MNCYRYAIFIFLFLGCGPFRNSPFSDQILRSERQLNQISLAQLGDIEADGKIRFAVISDSHQNYQDLDRAIVQINQTPDLDFVVNLGDFTNSGYNFEFDQFLDSYVLIKAQVFNLLGNHDAVGAGIELFRRVFGPSQFWFESDSRRFIFFNSVNLEDPEHFDSAWLKSAVQTSSKPSIVFSHVHLRDPQRFFNGDASDLASVIESSKVQLILNGHNHIYSLSRDHNTLMLECPRVESVQWLLLEIQGQQISITQMWTGEKIFETLKN